MASIVRNPKPSPAPQVSARSATQIHVTSNLGLSALKPRARTLIFLQSRPQSRLPELWVRDLNTPCFDTSIAGCCSMNLVVEFRVHLSARLCMVCLNHGPETLLVHIRRVLCAVLAIDASCHYSVRYSRTMFVLLRVGRSASPLPARRHPRIGVCVFVCEITWESERSCLGWPRRRSPKGAHLCLY